LSIFGKLLGLVELCRPANGITAGTGPAAAAVVCGAPSATAAKLFLAGFLTYCAGAAFNDLLDRKTDKKERPERPLPRGAVTPAACAILVAALFSTAVLAGFSVSLKVGLWFAGVCALAAGYDRLKSSLFFRFFLMGASRGANWAGGLLACPTIVLLWAPIVVFMWTQLLVFLALKKHHTAVAFGILAFSLFDAILVTTVCTWRAGLLFYGALGVAAAGGRLFRMT